MTMSGPELSGNIYDAIVANSGSAPINAAELHSFCDAIGDTVVTYIQSKAVINVSNVSSGGDTAHGTIS